MDIIKTNFKYASPLIPIDLRKIFFILLHHAAAPTAPPNQVHMWHLDRYDMVNGVKVYWKGFGYNWYVTKSADVYEGRGWHIGAQCSNMNSKSIGIGFEGDFTKEVMPEKQMKAGAELIKWLLPQLPNRVDILPHNKFQSTSCPGQNFPICGILDQVWSRQLEKDLAVIASKNIVQTPGYWLQNANYGKVCNGEYAGILIHRFADYIRKVN